MRHALERRLAGSGFCEEWRSIVVLSRESRGAPSSITASDESRSGRSVGRRDRGACCKRPRLLHSRADIVEGVRRFQRCLMGATLLNRSVTRLHTHEDAKRAFPACRAARRMPCGRSLLAPSSQMHYVVRSRVSDRRPLLATWRRDKKKGAPKGPFPRNMKRWISSSGRCRLR